MWISSPTTLPNSSPRSSTSPLEAVASCSRIDTARGLKLVEAADDPPGLVGGVDEIDDVLVAGGDRALLGKEIEVDRPFPERLAEQDHRHALHAAGLDQGQR